MASTTSIARRTLAGSTSPSESKYPPWMRTRLTPYLARRRARARRASGSFSSWGGPLTPQNRTGRPVSPCTNCEPLTAMKPPSPATFSFSPRRSKAPVSRQGSRFGSKANQPLFSSARRLAYSASCSGFKCPRAWNGSLASTKQSRYPWLLFLLSMRKAIVLPPFLIATRPTLTQTRNRRSGRLSAAMFTLPVWSFWRSIGVHGPSLRR